MNTRTKENFYHPSFLEEGVVPGLHEIFSLGAITICNPEFSDEQRQQIRDEATKSSQENQSVPSDDVLSQVTIRDVSIKALKDGDPDIELLVIEPKADNGKRAGLYEIHPGGWVLGDNRMGINSNIMTVINHNAVFISPNYYLAPEFTHSSIIDSLEAGVKWMLENSEELNLDTSRVVVRGNSAGAHLAAAISHRLKLKEYDFQFCAQLLNNPMLDDRSIYQSNFVSTDACWSLEAGVATWKAFLGDDYGTPYVPEDAAPARATNFKGLPPTIIHVAEHDHDRDACIEYTKNIMQAGIFADLHVHGGQYHASFFFQPSATEIRSEIQRGLELALTGKLVRK